jgi:hypothetical protein
MKTMYEILMAAPPPLVTRCKIAMVEIAHGHWAAAALTLENAICEAEPGEWTLDCMEMRDFCLLMDKVKYEGVEGIEKPRKNCRDRLFVIEMRA